MAAMKPRTGDGPLEVVEEGRSIIVRVPLEGGGRLVVESAAAEAAALRDALEGVIKAGAYGSAATAPHHPVRGRRRASGPQDRRQHAVAAARERRDQVLGLGDGLQQ